MSLHTGRNVVLQTYDNFLSRRLAAVWLSDELYKVRLFGNFLWVYFCVFATHYREEITNKTACRYCIVIDWNWISLNKIAVQPPFGGLRGNVHTSSMARWKARGWLSVRFNRTFFAISYDWDVIAGNLSMSAFFEGVGHLSANLRQKEGRPPTTVGIGKLKWLPFRVLSKYPQCIVRSCHKARVWQTDRQADRITIPETELA